MGRLSRYKYSALLVTLLVLVVLYPVFRERSGWPALLHCALTAVFLVGGWVALGDHRLRLLGLLLGVPAVVGVWTGYVFPGLSPPAAAVVFHLSAAVFLGFVVVVLLRGVFRERTITAHTISGALCGYFLMGVAFGHAYGLVEAVKPGSLQGVQGPEGETEHALLLYFSFITLTTVGYGEITPATPAARSLSVLEAVLGQFYLAVLIAGLVGKSLAQKPGSTDPPAPG